MDATTTRVPEVVDAFVARMTTALDGVAEVVDGPVAAENLPEVVLVVGWPGDDGDAVSNTVERAQGYGHRYVEVFEIHCVASVVSGDVDMKATRDRAKAIVDAVSVALKADRALGGVCDLVNLGPSMRWAEAQTPDGSVCEVLFSVAGKAAL